MTETGCVFCDLTQFRAADVCIENAFCLYASTRDPRDPPDVLPGCGVIIPIAHRPSPFDFTAEEWSATHELLLEAKAAQDERLAPDGSTMGCGFPKEFRQAAVDAEPVKFSLPSESDMRFNWIHVTLAAIDVEEMRDLVEGAWSRAVPKYVAEEYASAQGYF